MTLKINKGCMSWKFIYGGVKICKVEGIGEWGTGRMGGDGEWEIGGMGDRGNVVL
jgi:hypothetical protein